MRPNPDDHLYNRRLIAYAGLIFSAFWVLQVFWIDVLFADMDTGKVIAYLGVPPALAGLGFWKYLEACKRDDEK